MSPPPLRPVLLALTVASCEPGTGLDGPRFDPLSGGDGPCFELDVTDGFADGAEVRALFDCVNRYGAFDELEPLAGWLTTSDRVPPLLDAVEPRLQTIEVPDLVDTVVVVLLDDPRPVDPLLNAYAELYDDALLTPLLAVVEVAAAHQDACEVGAAPTECSAVRLLRALLDTPLLDLLAGTFDALSRAAPDDAPALLDTLRDLVVATSAAENPGQGNVLLALGRFLLAAQPDGRVPAFVLVDGLAPLLADDTLVNALAAELARAERLGLLPGLAADVEVLFTHDVDGNEVGFSGPTIVDALLGVLTALDPALLEEPFTLPGSDEPVVLLDLVLDTLDDLYRQQADVTAILAELRDVTDLLCGSDASNELCDLVSDLLPPVSAAVEQTSALPDLVLPLAHVLHTHADVPALLDLLRDLLAWDVLGRAEPLLRFAVERDLVSDLVDVAPALLQPRLGRLSPAGVDAIAALRLTLGEVDVDGVAVSPLRTLAPMLRALLDPPNPDANLDPLAVALATRLTDPASALHLDTLLDALAPILDALPGGTPDLESLARDLLADEPLWRSALHLFAAEDLHALLRPDPVGGDATAWLRELIGDGLVDRMLNWFAGLIRQLIDIGLLDAPPAPDAP